MCVDANHKKTINADCTETTEDNSAASFNCAKQSGVCAGSKKKCVGTNWQSSCTDAEYIAWSPKYSTVESGSLCQSGEGYDNDCDGCFDLRDKSCTPSCSDANNDGCCD
jgi:hypothetical protein